MAAAAMLSGLLLLTGGPLNTFARDVNFNGRPNGFGVYSGSNVRVYGGVSDLFGDDAKELVPGSVKNFTVQFRNYSPDPVEFFLCAEPVTGESASALTDIEDEDFAGKTANDALLDLVQITVRRETGGTVLYSGPLRGSGTGMYGSATARGVSLGTLGAGLYGTLDITIEVSAKADNAYQNTLCAVNWTFYADQYEPTTTPAEQPGTTTTETATSETTTTETATTETTTTEPATTESVTTEPATSAPVTTEPPATESPTSSGEPGVTEPPASSEEPSATAPPTGGGMSGDASAGGPPANPDQTIPDSEIPLGSIGEDLIEILPENETPMGSAAVDPDMVVVVPQIPLALPQTGGFLTYASVAGLALAGLLIFYGATFIKRQRRTDPEEE
jgi:hypothetical protein